MILPTAQETGEWLRALTHAGAVAAVAVGAALVLHALVFGMMTRIARLSQLESDGVVAARLREPLRWAFVAVAVSIAAESSPSLAEFWDKVARFVVPALLGWTALALVKAFATALENRAELAADDLTARSRRTRVAILSRTVGFVIVFITVALMLLGIPGVRNVGATLLASAGVATLAVGAAAQPALKSLIAGVQMALTEPIRIGDLVVIDGHTGRIEAIKMSFVILKTWDERRVIVPTSRFLDATFENWTRQGDALTGSVLLHLDPATDVARVRAEYERVLAAQTLWDKRLGALAVTDAKPESIELRLAMSAADSASLADLRNKVREAMFDWLRREMPAALLRHAAAEEKS